MKYSNVFSPTRLYAMLRSPSALPALLTSLSGFWKTDIGHSYASYRRIRYLERRILLDVE